MSLLVNATAPRFPPKADTSFCHHKLVFLLLSQQIRKLRRELESSQEKVATLTSQLSANVSAVKRGGPGGGSGRESDAFGQRRRILS